MSNSQSRILTTVSALLLCLTCSQTVIAGWTLNEEESSLYYVTSKAAALSELNTFAELSGSIDNDGSASIAITLGSVDTAIDIRNERMREFVFQIATYPLATVSIAADGNILSGLEAGDIYSATYQANIDLHGMQRTMPIEVVVSALKEGGLLVVLARPLIVNAASFGLAQGVEQLREIAGLPSINNNVIIDFTLQFDLTD